MGIHAIKDIPVIQRKSLDIIQINLGNLCNQSCKHCHIEASPSGKKIMSLATADQIIHKLADMPVKKIELTGGAPEMNPHFRHMVKSLRKAGKEITVRTNLTILEDPEYRDLIDWFQLQNVKLVASLPSTQPEETDKQRGKGIYTKSIRVLKILNEKGYGTNGHSLDLVSNSTADTIPENPSLTEQQFRSELQKKHGVFFNNFITITNTPIKRYQKHLKKNGKEEDYLKLLQEKYNPDTLPNLMCRTLITIDYRGYIYDCDFSLAEDNRIAGYENLKFWEVDFDNFKPQVSWFDYCAACTASEGSSCFGSLAGKSSVVPSLNFKENARNYYGETIQSYSDLSTSACCDPSAIPDHIKKILAQIDDEILTRYYGCGSPLPDALENMKVLDLGCGTGRDVYIASRLVGENGFAYGIDMTDSQIDVAKKHISGMMKKFGYSRPNADFIHDDIESISKYFSEESIDIIISNCVINLLQNKKSVLEQIYGILKFGGEFYFSDIYADRRLPDNIKNDPLLHGECLGGALYINDFLRIARNAGFSDPREISSHEISINSEIKKLTGNARFHSITYRLWKLENLEERCEDYGHVAVYRGGLEESPFSFSLDGGHVFEKNRPERVCGNTALMVSKTRFAPYFNVTGSFEEHFGDFETCSTSASAASGEAPASSCGC